MDMTNPPETQTDRHDSGWFAPSGLFSEGEILRNHAIHAADGRIDAVAAIADLPQTTRPRPLAGILAPGAVDLQVNGGGGILFNTSPTRAGLGQMVDAHRRLGTARILATVISDTEAATEAAVAAVCDNWGLPGLAGIHIEGPHISPVKRGTHSAAVLRPLSDHTLGLIRRLREMDIPTMITLAPEVVPPAQIRTLADLGAVVSLGHSNASFAQACGALAAGASCFTHLFNAMSPFGSREPGMVGAALAGDAAVGFICDGHHVSDDTLKIALSVSGATDRFFLVSDAMPTVGGPEAFALYGQPIRVSDGRLINAEGALAGAHVWMTAAMTRARNVLGLPTETVLRMAITRPAALMGLRDAAALRGRPLGDLVVWDEDLRSCSALTDILAFDQDGQVRSAATTG
ncbi:N-acetylglucosamine-6-phosphate deacetylase [Paracoccus pacificus]|uniref:N-acetylglucosamine-6-phosphate deacetylase n=1 Tax=Paracoccus pacificus TaxID=1463598 RepID=A0ABW4R7N5_9RHOB